MDRRTDAYIESLRDQMVEDLKILVRIDSQRAPAQPGKPFGEGPAMAVKTAGQLMEKYGLEVTNYDNYAIAGDYGEGEKELDILAHLDVVPVSDGWKVTEPFTPLVKDRRIYGRGTADDKGPAIAALYAIRAIKDLGIPLKKSVRLVLGSDEECGSSDLEHYYSIEKEAPFTFSPDADWPVINIEKARLAGPFYAQFDPEEDKKAAEEGKTLVCRFEAGSKVNVVPGRADAWVTGISREDLSAYASKAQEHTGAVITITEENGLLHIFSKGQTAHASTPDHGNNALTALLYLLASLPLARTKGQETLKALAHLFEHGVTDGKAQGIYMKDEESGEVTITLDMLSYDSSTLSGEFDCRAPLCATDQNLTEVLREGFRKAGIVMEPDHMAPAHHVSADSPFVKTLLKTYEEYTGKSGKALSTGGGTYVHRLERGVAFGCMTEEVDNHMHGDDEFMVIDMMVESAKIFCAVIQKLCS